MLTHGALSAGEPQLYGEGKPEEELLAMEEQIAALSWLYGGAPAIAGFGPGESCL